MPERLSDEDLRTINDFGGNIAIHAFPNEEWEVGDVVAEALARGAEISHLKEELREREAEAAVLRDELGALVEVTRKALRGSHWSNQQIPAGILDALKNGEAALSPGASQQHLSYVRALEQVVEAARELKSVVDMFGADWPHLIPRINALTGTTAIDGGEETSSRSRELG